MRKNWCRAGYIVTAVICLKKFQNWYQTSVSLTSLGDQRYWSVTTAICCTKHSTICVSHKKIVITKSYITIAQTCCNVLCLWLYLRLLFQVLEPVFSVSHQVKGVAVIIRVGCASITGTQTHTDFQILAISILISTIYHLYQGTWFCPRSIRISMCSILFVCKQDNSSSYISLAQNLVPWQMIDKGWTSLILMELGRVRSSTTYWQNPPPPPKKKKKKPLCARTLIWNKARCSRGMALLSTLSAPLRSWFNNNSAYNEYSAKQSLKNLIHIMTSFGTCAKITWHSLLPVPWPSID